MLVLCLQVSVQGTCMAYVCLMRCLHYVRLFAVGAFIHDAMICYVLAGQCQWKGYVFGGGIDI